jgi:hypothetical protein
MEGLYRITERQHKNIVPTHTCQSVGSWLSRVSDTGAGIHMVYDEAKGEVNNFYNVYLCLITYVEHVSSTGNMNMYINFD